MEAKDYQFDVIRLHYCPKHKEYWTSNCGDCMADDYEKQGRREVVEWIQTHPGKDKHTWDEWFEWQAKLKEWGL